MRTLLLKPGGASEHLCVSSPLRRHKRTQRRLGSSSGSSGLASEALFM